METEFNKAQTQYKFLTFDQTSFVTDNSTFMRLKIRMSKIELYTIAQMEVSMSSNNLIPCTVQNSIPYHRGLDPENAPSKLTPAINIH